MGDETQTDETLVEYFEQISECKESDDTRFMCYEFIRLKSFRNWPQESCCFAIRLAAAGLYYTGETVKCFQCDFVKELWQKGEQPFELHRRNNPCCPFVDGSCRTNISIPVVSGNFIPEKFNRIRHLFGAQYPGQRMLSASLPQGSRSPLASPEDYVRSRSLESTGDSSRSHSTPAVSHETERYSGRIPLRLPSVDWTNMDDHEAPASNQDQNTRSSDSQEGETGERSSSGSLGRSRPMALGTGMPSRHRVGRIRISSSEPRILSNSATAELPALGRLSSQGKAETVQGPGSSRQQTAVLERDPGHLRFERNRLETFREWPTTSPVTPRDLSRSGFYYTGCEDRVQCIYCRGVLKGWDPGDVVHIEHRNKFPRCQFILGMDVGNIPYAPNQPMHNNPINQNARFSQQAPSQMEALGINMDRPKHPHYAIEASRLSSYRSWPTYKHQTPEHLSKAGFFYANYGDNVKCFYCDGGLKNWEPGDDPWEEHARWFPKCPFVRSVKGEAYIQSVQDRFNTGTQQQTIVNRGRKRPSGQRYPIEEREVKARMELPMVLAVLGTGVNRDVVMQAIRNRLEDIGDDFPNAEALMNAALEMNDDPDQFTHITTRRSGSRSPPTVSSEAEGSGSDPSTSKDESIASAKLEDPDLTEEIRNLKDQKTCKICLDEEVGMVFLPCGHLCACVSCAPAVQQCPICRCDIRGTVRTYMS